MAQETNNIAYTCIQFGNSRFFCQLTKEIKTSLISHCYKIYNFLDNRRKLKFIFLGFFNYLVNAVFQ